MSSPANVGAPQSTERRNLPARRALFLQSRLTSASGVSLAVDVLNLSLEGILLKANSRFAVGEKVQLHFESGAERGATIMWSSDKLYGCQFAEPLSKGQLSAALLRGDEGQPPSLEDSLQLAAHSLPHNAIDGHSIARLRKVRGLTQAELAAGIGVSKTSVWKWENGATQPRPTMAARLAQFLNTPQFSQHSTPSLAIGEFGQHHATPQGDTLQAIVNWSKAAIALAAGTTSNQITIHIEI